MSPRKLSSVRGIVTRARLLIVVSLVFTWWVAHVVPQYEAAIADPVETIKKMVFNLSFQPYWIGAPYSRYNASKVAVLIEPEPDSGLVPLILHMLAVVPQDWQFLFVGSKRSAFIVGRSHGVQPWLAAGKMSLVVLPKPWSIQTDEDQSRLWTDVRFYDEFLPDAEWILKYGRDSILCANSEQDLNQWLDWSWAGAARPDDRGFAGYGSLSLRRVSAIKEVIGFQRRYNDTEREDEWFGKRLRALPGVKVANLTYGVLAAGNQPMEMPMGYWAPERGRGLDKEIWQAPEHRKDVLRYCPELSLIVDMKLDRERCPGDNMQGDIVQRE